MLQKAFINSPLLRSELQLQLFRFKQSYCALLSGFGRFRTVKVLQGESLLALMKRTHDDSLTWRPPGRHASFLRAVLLRLLTRARKC